MKLHLEDNWTSTNNKQPLADAEVERYLNVLPTAAQITHAQHPFYCFVHFGMNTATNREWGSATETVDDFTIAKIKPEQWMKAIKTAGATGVILTCKHHDGFCLWNTGTTDFNVMNSVYAGDMVRDIANACRAHGLAFGVYLSPWDMHEPCYATPAYNDFFCRQLTELLTQYGEIFEVWFDGAKGADAKAFDYDWERYYKVIRTLQPQANIAICGPDIRWVGNEGGNARENEYCVVPQYLSVAERIQEHSQQAENEAAKLQQLSCKDEDLGSRKVLAANQALIWYPAEVDVSISQGWFYHPHDKWKSVKQLFHIYLNSVGNNAFLLLNVAPTEKGVLPRKTVSRLKELGARIRQIEENPVLVKKYGALKDTDGYLEFTFDSPKQLRYCILEEDIAAGQRVEKFDLYYHTANGKYKKAYSGGVIGMRKIIALRGKADGMMLIIRQSRGVPVLQKIAFYE